MKYIFKYAENLEPGAYIISHSIFLSKDQRHALQKIGGTVRVDGVSVPVMADDDYTINDMAKEVFCRYELCTHDGPPSMALSGQEWKVFLSPEMAKSLDDIRDFHKDPGSQFLSFNLSSLLRKHPVVHQVVISCEEDLDSSLIHAVQECSR